MRDYHRGNRELSISTRWKGTVVYYKSVTMLYTLRPTVLEHTLSNLTNVECRRWWCSAGPNPSTTLRYAATRTRLPGNSAQYSDIPLSSAPCKWYPARKLALSLGGGRLRSSSWPSASAASGADAGAHLCPFLGTPHCRHMYTRSPDGGGCGRCGSSSSSARGTSGSGLMSIAASPSSTAGRASSQLESLQPTL